ncbi:MAG: alpha-amylase, partial [Odoribacter sp.]|nr:alpha-amylase [Odoribacter sp.]
INPKLKLLLRNFSLSDDITLRFSNRSWNEWPLTAEKYNQWLLENVEDKEIITLSMDYETFGVVHPQESGIFSFLYKLPEFVLSTSAFEFLTPAEAATKHQAVAPLNVPFPISWTDEERDLTAWLGNELQYEAFEELYKLYPKVRTVNREDLNHDYSCLQSSEHFYYMCTKLFHDGVSNKGNSPYESPYAAFINYMNILSDFIDRLNQNANPDAVTQVKKTTPKKATTKNR